MASNDNNGKHKVVEEAESSTATRKRLWFSDDDGSVDSSGDSEEETEPETEEEETAEEEVSFEESSMNLVDTSEEKLMAKRGHGLLFSDDGDTSSTESDPHSPETPSSRVRSDPNCSDDNDDDDDFYM
jgi:predicted nucleic acid-binding protein